MEFSFTQHHWCGPKMPLVSIRVVFPQGCRHSHFAKEKVWKKALPSPCLLTIPMWKGSLLSHLIAILVWSLQLLWLISPSKSQALNEDQNNLGWWCYVYDPKSRFPWIPSVSSRMCSGLSSHGAALEMMCEHLAGMQRWHRWTPSYNGSSSSKFWLEPMQKCVVEVRFASMQGLDWKGNSNILTLCCCWRKTANKWQGWWLIAYISKLCLTTGSQNHHRCFIENTSNQHILMQLYPLTIWSDNWRHWTSTK